MKNTLMQIKRSGAVVAMAVAVMLCLAPPSAFGQRRSAPTIVSPDATYHGKTYAEWSADATRFGLEHPLEGHPGLDTPDFDVRSGQHGEVWFLSGPFDTHERSITVPAGKALFVMLLNVDASSLEEPPFHGDTAAEQLAIAKFFGTHMKEVFFEIDGEAIENMDDFHVSSPQFEFTAPTPWLFGAVGGTGTAVADGYYVMLERLPKGEHTIHFGGVFRFTLAEDGFDAELPIDMTYHVTVK
jgi:hypothetical protein